MSRRAAGIQFDMVDMLLGTTAAGLWFALMSALWNNPYVPPAMVAMSLAGTTGAIHLLLRRRPHAWPVSAMLAPLVTGLSLAGVLTLFPQ